MNRGWNEHQLVYLRKVHTGEWGLILHRLPRGSTHVQKYGVRVAFCGKVITPIAKYKTYATYNEQTLAAAGICAACATAVRGAMEEALRTDPATLAEIFRKEADPHG